MVAKSPELRNLTSLRGIAALMVAFFHFRYFLPKMPGWMDNEIIRESYVWVDFFFILSGFILAYRYDSGTGHYGHFLRKRLARIYPLYFVTFVVAVLVAALKDHKAPDQWGSLLAHVFLIQNWGYPFTPRWNYPAWSLSCEWAAYLVFPLFLFVCRKASAKTLVVWLLVAALFCAHYWFCANVVGGNIGNINNYPLFRCFTEFALGMLGYQIRKSWEQEGSKLCDFAQGLLLVLIFFSLNSKVSDFYFVFLSFFLILVASQAKGPLTALLGSRPLYFLGEISYSVYLNQILLLIFFDTLVIHWWPSFGRWTAEVYFVLRIAALLLVSTATYVFIERTGKRWMLSPKAVWR